MYSDFEMEDADEVLLGIINQLNRSLDDPNCVSSTGIHNNKEHLLNFFGLSQENNDETILKEWEGEKPTPDVPSASDQSSSKVLSIQELNQNSCNSSNQSCFKPSSNTLTGVQKHTENKNSALKLEDLPSINSENSRTTTVDSEDFKAAQNEIQQLENSGPAGIAHLSALSHVVNTRIAIWTSSMSLYGEAGRNIPGEALNVQYHTQPNENLGHWTLIGDEDPSELLGNDLNNCLFNAIAAQTGYDPSVLRADTVNVMKKHIKSFANRIKRLAQENEYSRIVLMVGGARYKGKNENDAKEILDNSQAETSHPGRLRGHARGHASNLSSNDPQGSVENYSKHGWKTGFLNQDDQNRALHDVLRTSKAKAAMEALNDGETSTSVHVSASEVQNPPLGANYNHGVQGSVHPIREYVIVLRHFVGHSRDPDYNVFVHTFYPVLDQSTPATQNN